MFRVLLWIQFYRLMQLLLSTLLKGIIRKECQLFTNHGHAKTPPAVFNPLSLWLTLPRDMGSATHYCLPALLEPFLRACGLHRVCTRHKKTKQQSRSIMLRVLCIQFYRLMQLIFSTLFKGIIRKNANHLQTTGTLKRHQRYSIHYHCGWPSLGIWGSATHYGLTALPGHSCVPVVCTGFAQGSKKIKTAEPFYDVKGDSMYSIISVDATCFSTLLNHL